VDRRPVTVGVDGSPESMVALGPALAEATRAELPLRIVYADELAGHQGWAGARTAAGAANEVVRRPTRILREALEYATGATVPVHGEAVAGGAMRVLLRESTGSSLLTVGHRSRGGGVGLLLGSVAAKLATHAACPVLIVQGRPQPEGDVVVGVDGSPGEETAIGFAFEEAARRHADLVAVHTWLGPNTPLDQMLPAAYPSPAQAQRARVLTDSLAGWQEKYPAVRIRRRLVHGHPARTLVEASGRAQLVVIGPGRLGDPGLFRSVKHALLHHGACPVAVVHRAL
jgi:nucleotide-binding universal stress UspA family protein